MLLIILFSLSSFLLLSLSIYYGKRDFSNFIAFVPFIFFSSLAFMFSLVHYKHTKCKELLKEVNVTVIEKYIGESCSNKGRSCSREYMFVLKTDKGYLYEKSFNVDTYHRFNPGDKISYSPSNCSHVEFLLDK